MSSNPILSLRHAQALDKFDSLRDWREKFWIPRRPDGREQLYFCGNSLGLQPRSLAQAMQDELEKWQSMGVEGHFLGDQPWTHFPEMLAESTANLVGAKTDEVTIMNSLTVNLHLLMVSFYRPSGRRRKILMEPQPFPSDRYAAESQIRLHGLDPEDCLVEFPNGNGSLIVEESQLEAWLRENGADIALVLWPGVQYASGQRFDITRVCAAAHRAGAMCGLDLAHSIGNVPLNLHDAGADFAVWCNYKYLNAGAGAVAGCFVNERHAGRTDLARLHGWWGNRLASRFRMQQRFEPAHGAHAWQLSNPPILAMTPLQVSLDIFRQAGMKALREKSISMTAYLEELIRAELHDELDIVTPAEPQRRGCQLSLRIRAGRQAGLELIRQLESAGTVPDWREPDLIRVSPVPLYNSFEDCWRFVQQVKHLLSAGIR